jgi:Domain of unknown function (DUF4314)
VFQASYGPRGIGTAWECQVCGREWVKVGGHFHDPHDHPHVFDLADFQCAPASPGDRIRLVHTGDACTRLQPGTLGTVRLVDDHGTVHTDRDDGSRLGLSAASRDQWDLTGRHVAATRPQPDPLPGGPPAPAAQIAEASPRPPWHGRGWQPATADLPGRRSDGWRG